MLASTNSKARYSVVGFLLLVLIFACRTAAADEDQNIREVYALPWQSSPASGVVGTVARIQLTKDLRFLDDVSASRFLQLNGNPPHANTYVLAPSQIAWFAVFSFDQSGYVKDDESLDPDSLLNTLKQQNRAGIEERRRLKLPILTLDGWAVAPHYDVQTRRLEWGTRLLGENGQTIVNYTIRIMGRTGVMAATLVSDPTSLDQDIEKFKAALVGFDFVPGERYSEFRQGDRVAEFGLAALIVGGAAAAAAKTGVMKGLGKFIGLGVLAVFGAVVSFFKRLFKRKSA